MQVVMALRSYAVDQASSTAIRRRALNTPFTSLFSGSQVYAANIAPEIAEQMLR